MKCQKDFGRKSLKNNTYMKEAMCEHSLFLCKKSSCANINENAKPNGEKDNVRICDSANIYFRKE